MLPGFYHDPDHLPFTFEGGRSRALIIHGFLGSPRDMRPLGRELANAGVTARGILLPGFAAAVDELGRVRARDWVAAAHDAWQELQAGATHTAVIGFSMGGAVALRLAAEAGVSPDELILLAPHWRIADRRSVVLPVAKHVIRRFKPFGPLDLDDPEVRRMFAGVAAGIDLDDPAVRRRYRNAGAVPTRALDELRRIGHSAAKAAPRITARTTILQGQQDPTTVPAFSRALAARMGADLIEFPGDHLIVDPERPSWATVRRLVVSRVSGLE
jgi:carboxylesterase